MKDKIDFEQKFYVRLEDQTALWFQLDVSQLDRARLDSEPTLQERIIASNNRRLRGLQ